MSLDESVALVQDALANARPGHLFVRKQASTVSQPSRPGLDQRSDWGRAAGCDRAWESTIGSQVTQ